MNFLILVIVGIGGIWLGKKLALNKLRRDSEYARDTESFNEVNEERHEKKEKAKEKILEFTRKNGQVTNDDVENLVSVSDATSTNYLTELEGEGKLIQKGESGRGVFYILK